MKYSAENFCRQARRRSCAYRLYVKRRQQSLAAKRPAIYFMFPLDEALDAWSARLNAKLEQQRQSYQANLTQQQVALQADITALAEEAIDEAVIQKRVKQNGLEMKVGLNGLNKLGILLILFGVGTLARHSYSTWFNEYMKGVFIFLLGGSLLGAGEWFYRKGKDVFATGLLGGGVSVLYTGVFFSYFLLHIMLLPASLIVSVLITVIAVILSLRYQSVVICSLGLIGGYLPFYSYLFAFGFSGTAYYAAMGYLFLLNSMILLVSLRNKWHVVKYISLVIHVPALLWLTFDVPDTVIGIAYATAAFGVYLAITLGYPLKYKEGIERAGVVFLGINTFLSCSVLYSLFFKAGWHEYNGALALGFCLIYGGLALLCTKRIPAEKSTSVLFYATALTFAILMIPFHLGVRWMAMGWLIEGVILIVCGICHKLPKMEKSGWLIFGFCLTAFLWFDTLLKIFTDIPYYDYKFTAVVAGMVTVTITYLRDFQKNPVRYGLWWSHIQRFKHCTIITSWLYLLYVNGRLYEIAQASGYYVEFYRIITAAMITVSMAYIMPRIPHLGDKTVRGIGYGWYGLAMVACYGLNVFLPLLPVTIQDRSTGYVAIGVLIVYNLFMFAIFTALLPALMRKRNMNFEVFPLLVLAYLLTDITGFLAVQCRLDSTNLVFSLLYLFMAIGSIYYGFRRKFAYIRRVGLVLSLLATTKLFLYDLHYLDTFYKIFAYFCFGMVLLAISYLYQKLKNSGNGCERSDQ